MSKRKSQLCPSPYTDILRASISFVSEEYWLEVVDLCGRTVYKCSLGRWDSLRLSQLYLKLCHSLSRPVGDVPIVWRGFVLTSCNYFSLVHIREILGGVLSHGSSDGDARSFAESIVELELWDD